TPFSRGKIPVIVHRRVGKWSLGLGDVFLDVQSLPRRDLRTQEALARSHQPGFPRAHRGVAVGESRVREREERVRLDRLLEELDGLAGVTRASIPKEAPLQIEPVGL